MLRNPLLEKFKAKKTAIGLYVNDPDSVELCAHVGFDWFMIDQMFTALDWNKTQQMIRAGEAAGITPVVRVQSNPWIGYDHHIAVDVQRAQGIGAQFIRVSFSDKKEIEECLATAKDWHRKALWIHPFRDNNEWDAGIDEMAEATFIQPSAESKGALAAIDEVLEMPGLKTFNIAMTDASKMITGEKKPDWYHLKLWQYVDKVVKAAERKGIMVSAGTSYAYSLKEMGERVRRLHGAGVRMILAQGAPFLLQLAAIELLDGVRADLKL